LRRLDDIHPLPVGFKDILPKKLQAIPVNLNGTPGVTAIKLRIFNFKSTVFSIAYDNSTKR